MGHHRPISNQKEFYLRLRGKKTRSFQDRSHGSALQGSSPGGSRRRDPPARSLERAQELRPGDAADSRLLFSQRVLLALVEKGLSREDAYKIVQTNSMKTWDEDKDFRELIRSDSEVASQISSIELDGIFDNKYYVRHVDEIFQRVGLN